MISLRQLSRRSAAAIHLGISAVIAAAAMTIMLLLWYPPPLFGGMGGTELIVLIIGVDVAIGPLLTFVVFDPRKEELAFDLTVIAVLQTCALGYGVYAMHEGRPVFIAFVENRFAVVSAAEIEDELLLKARPEYRSRPETGPMVVAVDMPSDAGERIDLFFAGIAGMGAQHLPQYYVPYQERRAKVLAAAAPLSGISNLSAEERAELDSAIARTHRAPGELRFVPVLTRSTTLTALIDGESGALLTMAAANPTNR